ncbi:MAG: hypothetical protein ACK4K9_08055 [Bacteroidia bacterium]
MNTLNQNWFFTDLLDLEYKQYILLAYLKDVKQSFNQTKLYPPLADLVQHYRNLIDYIKTRTDLYNNFKQELKGIDLEKLKAVYENSVNDDELMKTIDEIVNYSIPKIKKVLDEGKEIYEFVEQEMIMEPIGILPIYQNEGYLIVKDGNNKDINVYEYEVKLFERRTEKYRSVRTSLVKTYTQSFVNTMENIKVNLIKERKKLPNPATFAVSTKYYFPLEETLMHIAKRKLFNYISI